MLKSFAELEQRVKSMKNKTRVAVVAANDAHTLEAVLRAVKGELIEAILIGNQEEIARLLTEQGENPQAYHIVHEPDIDACMMVAVELIHQKKADAIMKGKLETAQLMRAIVKKENGLRKGGLISVVGLFEVPRYHKLLAVTDMAINMYPDLEGKKHIVNNGVHLLHAVGLENPKVAVLSAVEKVNPKMPDTVDADALKKMNQAGEITGCVVEGPISIDIATSKEAATIKGFDSPVAGDADLLVVPDIVSGNLLGKCLTGFSGATTAGVVLGATVPVILTPRSAEASDKYYSIALAAYTAQSF